MIPSLTIAECIQFPNIFSRYWYHSTLFHSFITVKMQKAEDVVSWQYAELWNVYRNWILKFERWNESGIWKITVKKYSFFYDFPRTFSVASTNKSSVRPSDRSIDNCIQKIPNIFGYIFCDWMRFFRDVCLKKKRRFYLVRHSSSPFRYFAHWITKNSVKEKWFFYVKTIVKICWSWWSNYVHQNTRI